MKLGQHPALGRAEGGQPGFVLAHQQDVLRQLAMQELGGLGPHNTDHAGLGQMDNTIQVLGQGSVQGSTHGVNYHGRR